jgi:iron(III) transport system substrate-binding protein
MNKLTGLFFSAALLLGATHTAVMAQDSAKAAEVLALASYQGADRHDKLVAAAQKEGELSVYHAYPKLTVAMDAFGKKYGIKIKAWRAGSEAILQRVTTESQAGRNEVDIVQNNAPENEAAYREKLLLPVWSPYQKDLIAGASPSHKAWTAITLDVFTAAYNTNVVKKQDLPKSYEDLQDPKWKGLLAVEANDEAWFGSLMEELGQARGTKIFNNIVANNGISVRKGHSTLTNLIASGDIPLGLSVYSWNPVQLKKKGAPIEGWNIQPLIAQPSSIAMLKNATHPASALLFYDFMLSEGQKILADADFVPTSKLYQGEWLNVPLKMIDPGRALDMQDKWRSSFEEMIVKRAK